MSALEAVAAGVEPVAKSTLRLVRRMNGSAQGLLVADATQRLWVLKLRSSRHAPHASANELIGSRLCRALGLPTPDWALLDVDPDFFDDPRTRLRTAGGAEAAPAGPHFASRYLPDALQKDCFELIPPTLQATIQNRTACLGMFLFDVWAMHADSRQALFTLEESGLFPTFFDHGHLFGGVDGRARRAVLDGRLLQQIALRAAEDGGDVDGWIARMQRTLPSALDLALAATPPAWKTQGLCGLRSTLLFRLDTFRPLADLALAALEFRVKEMRENEPFHLGADVRVLSHGGAEQWA